MISVDFLQSPNAAEVAQAIQRALLDYSIGYSQVRALASDNAAYMKACFAILTGLYPRMIHVTCWSHILSLVGNCWRDGLPSVDRLVACIKSIFVKSPNRRRSWCELLETRNKPALTFPIPVITRWNSWFKSVDFINEHYDDLLQFVNEELAKRQRTAKLEELTTLMDSEQLKREVAFLARYSGRIQRDLIAMEAACPSQVRPCYKFIFLVA